MSLYHISLRFARNVVLSIERDNCPIFSVSKYVRVNKPQAKRNAQVALRIAIDGDPSCGIVQAIQGLGKSSRLIYAF